MSSQRSVRVFFLRYIKFNPHSRSGSQRAPAGGLRTCIHSLEMRDELSIKPLGRRKRQLLGRFVEQLQRTAIRIRNADRCGENFVDEYLGIIFCHDP